MNSAVLPKVLMSH